MVGFEGTLGNPAHFLGRKCMLGKYGGRKAEGEGWVGTGFGGLRRGLGRPCLLGQDCGWCQVWVCRDESFGPLWECVSVQAKGRAWIVWRMGLDRGWPRIFVLDWRRGGACGREICWGDLSLIYYFICLLGDDLWLGGLLSVGFFFLGFFHFFSSYSVVVNVIVGVFVVYLFFPFWLVGCGG